MNELDLFAAAIALVEPAERAALLERECAGRPDLRVRLDELLDAHFRPEPLLDRRSLDQTGDHSATEIGDAPRENEPVVDATLDPTGFAQTGDRPATGVVIQHNRGKAEQAGVVIGGKYTLVEVVGEGGMGSVWRAKQTVPVKRFVAVKLIKAGMDSRQVLTRFEAERQALALMDHPNIAKVLDAGATEEGRPYFVMELVRGIPLTDYCDRHRLGLPERLALFRQICSAVQHAHQKGIIHRDLKPSNILVESHDDRPVPKVIDFGLAKATSGLQLSEHSLYSAFGSVAGTPLYMSPEQATFNAIDVDTRADIYSLGVILYELLTGSTPIERGTFKKAALDEMLRMIREVEPPTPSSRISSSDTLPSLAANRHAEPARLSRFVRGDLDWIVMKALAKERSRRYESAIGLANDIERFTNDEPVSAGPPTASYRFRKFVRRNRGQVVAATLIVASLVCGVLGTTLGLFKAKQQASLAAVRLAVANKRLQQKDKANEILLSIFRDLNPRGHEAAALPLSDRLGRSLDIATAELEGDATDDPLSVARLQMILGESQFVLGYPEKAIALAARARATLATRLGSSHADTLTSANDLAAGYSAVGKLDLAIQLFKETLALRETKLGRDHPETLVSMNKLAECYLVDGNLDLALPLIIETFGLMKANLGPDDRTTLTCMKNLGTAYFDAGKPELAIPIAVEALALARAKYGSDDPEALVMMNLLSRGYLVAGKFDLAVPLLEKALILGRTKLGPVHPETLTSMSNLAECYRTINKLDLAVPLLEEVVLLTKVKLGPKHRDTLIGMNNLALGYKFSGKTDLALSMEEEILALRRVVLGPNHPETLASLVNLAVTCRLTGKFDRAIVLADQAIKLQAAKSGTDHPDTWLAKGIQGINYMEVGRFEEAIPLLEGAHQMRHKNAAMRAAASYLVDTYARAGRPVEAATLARDMLAERSPDAPAESLQRAVLLGHVAIGLLAAKAWDEVEPILRECLTIREKTEPDAWTTFHTKSLLGAALLGRKQFTESEPLLKLGYEGIKQRADKIPPQGKIRLTQALDRLIELYTATNKPDKVKTWRAEREKYPEAKPEGKK